MKLVVILPIGQILSFCRYTSDQQPVITIGLQGLLLFTTSYYQGRSPNKQTNINYSSEPREHLREGLWYLRPTCILV